MTLVRENIEKLRKKKKKYKKKGIRKEKQLERKLFRFITSHVVPTNKLGKLVVSNLFHSFLFFFVIIIVPYSTRYIAVPYKTTGRTLRPPELTPFTIHSRYDKEYKVGGGRREENKRAKHACTAIYIYIFV